MRYRLGFTLQAQQRGWRLRTPGDARIVRKVAAEKLDRNLHNVFGRMAAEWAGVVFHLTGIF